MRKDVDSKTGDTQGEVHTGQEAREIKATEYAN